MKNKNLKKMVVVSLFCALAYICVFVFRFKVQFLTFDIKDAVITVCSFLYGPLSGIVVSAVVSLLEFITVSDTGIYGLIMNFLSSIAFCVPASLLYRKVKKTSTAVIGLALSVVSMTAVMIAANMLITPFYMGVGIEVVKSLIVPLLLPFNFIKAVLNSALTMIIYKPMVNSIRAVGLSEKSEQSAYKFNKTTVIVLVVSLLIAAIAVTFFIITLGGNFEIIRK